ncbi:hypothetical protein [uncultured Jatrophihabitans sp.]|uniref:hypothetical protein n=1 Tax=uncultured Jatrophihabitans sp. TaxID=1610747 RepID=UPI0035CC988B
MPSVAHAIAEAALPAAVAVVLLAVMLRDVTRARLERFARRQQLPITPENAITVVNYLATVRRWRVCGFVAGVVIEDACTFTQHGAWHVGASIIGPGALIGWFVGALVAEWRVESQRHAGPRRTASLAARRLRDYIPRWFATVTAVLWVIAIAAALFAIIRLGVAAPSLAVLAAALLATPICGVVARRVVNRPQSPAAPDVLAADDALRSRSLHVLTGCTLALNGMLAAFGLSVVLMSGSGLGVYSPLAALLGSIVVPFLGWLAATSPFGARRSFPVGVRAGVA